ncbi:MAG: hypothetical protein Q9167_006259 [Letrouitia subvulpina]
MTKDIASNDPVNVTHVPEYGTPPNHPIDAPSGFRLFPSCDIFHPEADERITIVHAISTTTRTVTVTPTFTTLHHLPAPSLTRRQDTVVDNGSWDSSLPTDRPIQLRNGTCLMDCNAAYQWLLMMRHSSIETHVPTTAATATHPPKMQKSSITTNLPPISVGTGAGMGALAPYLSSPSPSSSPHSTPPTPTPSHPAKHHQPLTTGAWLGIFFGGIIGGVALLAGVWLLARRARERKAKMNPRMRGVHMEREKDNRVWWREMGEEGGERQEKKGPGGVDMV